MEQVAQQNESLVSSMAQSAERLREQGSELMHAVSMFELGEASTPAASSREVESPSALSKAA